MGEEEFAHCGVEREAVYPRIFSRNDHYRARTIDDVARGDQLAATPERIDIIAAETEHLRRLINDLDILAQTDINTLSLNLEEVTLAEYLPQIAAKFAPSAAAKSVTLQLDPPSEALPPVRIDRERLAQVMGNVLTNALRHTPTEGTIRVTAKAVCHQVQLQVFDSGVGIAAAELPFVFDRFYQTDRSRSDKGKMGLGLAISKALVEAMGGEISAKSNGYNQGTTFTIALPTWG